MPTADEVRAARAELARRELARREAVRSGSGMVGAVANLGRARANTDFAPRPAPPRVQTGQRDLRSLIVDRPAAPVRGQSRGAVAEISGALANVNRGIPFFDEIAGTGLALDELISGRASNPVEAFDQGMARQRGIEDDFRARRPLAATAAQSTGTAASWLVPVGQAAQGTVQGGRLMAGARGAVTAAGQGAIYGLTDRGTIEERIQAGQLGAGTGAALGGVLGAAFARGRPSPPRVKPPTDRNVLRDAGVALTPGQAAGGPVKLAEDIGARLPILGSAIRGARARGGESFNRAAINRSLAPLGESVPASVRTGPDAIAYAQRRLGQAFEDAYALAPTVRLDQEFMASMQGITPRLGEITPSNRGVLTNIITDRLERLRAPDLTGAEAGRIRSEIAGTATRYLKAQDPNQQALGSVLRDIGNSLDELIARSDPTGRAGPALERAREGWGSFAVVRRAGANANTGTFTPGQLASAVRANDSSVAKGAVARGEANMQDLSGAAARVMPDSFGNPGTADVTSTLALGGLIGANPVAGVSVAGGLTAAAIPYWTMARNVAAKVPPNATRAQVQAAAAELDAIAARSPEASAAILALKDRIVRSAGAVGANATSERPSPPRQ